jgi:hypothetical protein
MFAAKRRFTIAAQVMCKNGWRRTCIHVKFGQFQCAAQLIANTSTSILSVIQSACNSPVTGIEALRPMHRHGRGGHRWKWLRAAHGFLSLARRIEARYRAIRSNQMPVDQ